MNYAISTPGEYLTGDVELKARAEPEWNMVGLMFRQSKDTEVEMSLSADEARLLSLRLMRLADQIDPLNAD